jgi:hypothetical protein
MPKPKFFSLAAPERRNPDARHLDPYGPQKQGITSKQMELVSILGIKASGYTKQKRSGCRVLFVLFLHNYS